MFQSFFLLLLTYVVIGLGLGILFYYGFRKPFLGGFWGFAALGILGASIGGLLDIAVVNVSELNIFQLPTPVFDRINFIPPFFGALILIVIAQVLYNAKDD